MTSYSSYRRLGFIIFVTPLHELWASKELWKHRNQVFESLKRLKHLHINGNRLERLPSSLISSNNGLFLLIENHSYLTFVGFITHNSYDMSHIKVAAHKRFGNLQCCWKFNSRSWSGKVSPPFRAFRIENQLENIKSGGESSIRTSSQLILK